MTRPLDNLADRVLSREPITPGDFAPETIVMAKGSLDTAARRAYVDRLCAVFPNAEVVRALDTSHHKMGLGLGSEDASARVHTGRRTLVVGSHGSPVQRNRETRVVCNPYWHFSCQGFCFYECAYCYLAGTRSIFFSPAVKVFINIETVLRKIQRVLQRASHPTPFYHGKLQDGLSLDNLTNFTKILVPFFAGQPLGRLLMLTKSTQVSNLLGLDHRGHTILSWSLNPSSIVDAYETRTPSLAKRLAAIRQCAEAGYPIRYQIMPLIPVPDWKDVYSESFVAELFKTHVPDRITLGGMCIYGFPMSLMRQRLDGDDPIFDALSTHGSVDGRIRYRPEVRIEMYQHLIHLIRAQYPLMEIGLCLEEASVWQKLSGLVSPGRCNCVL